MVKAYCNPFAANGKRIETDKMLVFLKEAVLISLAGVLLPGAMTAATLDLGRHRPHAGVLITLGHALVEVPLTLLILLGIVHIEQGSPLTGWIGLVGGCVLLWIAYGPIRELLTAWRQKSGGKASETTSPEVENRRNPLMVGVALSIGNPGFLIFWATIGLTLILKTKQWGVPGYTLFVIAHLLCDLIWLEILSYSSYAGSQRMGPAWQRAVMGICSCVLLYFGVQFIWTAWGILAG